MNDGPPEMKSLPNRDLTESDLEDLRSHPQVHFVEGVMWFGGLDEPGRTDDILIATDTKATHTARDIDTGKWLIYHQVEVEDEESPEEAAWALWVQFTEETYGVS